MEQIKLTDEELFKQIVNFPEGYEGATSSVTIPVLEFLIGKPFDDYAKSFLLALNPTRIVVNWFKLDAMNGRVNIITDENNIIKSILQQVEIMCLGDINDGYDLGIKSGLYEYKSNLNTKIYMNKDILEIQWIHAGQGRAYADSTYEAIISQKSIGTLLNNGIFYYTLSKDKIKEITKLLVRNFKDNPDNSFGDYFSPYLEICEAIGPTDEMIKECHEKWQPTKESRWRVLVRERYCD